MHVQRLRGLREVRVVLKVGGQRIEEVRTLGAIIFDEAAEDFSRKRAQLRTPLKLQEQTVNAQVAEILRALVAELVLQRHRPRRLAVALPQAEQGFGWPANSESKMRAREFLM